MEQYDHEHSSAWNKVFHAIGIPMIFVGIVLLILLKWMRGAGFFVGGWILLFLGHRIEGNKPAFFQGLVYLMVGPIWVAKELWMFLTGKDRANATSSDPTHRS
jgi:uncharacterized membrane protein YGL010W